VIGSEQFACPNCHLFLDDAELVLEAGLDDSFEVEGDYDDIGYDLEYNNE
jgi:hypothetical protein